MPRVVVPVSAVAEATLDNLLREFVTRDGTDYGALETTEDQRVAQLHAALRSGEAALVFDTDAETHDIIARGELPARQDGNGP